ncbi:MAG: hypothetical protein HY435_02195 [Candidatus Liptonbacteria bacterium]|nr:hypothetical protein [Candidatus Liptonbacteria bacterium]
MNQSETKTCQNCKTQFTIEPEDFLFYEKISVPPPTFCPECRAVRRYAFWSERTLFRKPEALAGKEVFSTFSKASPVKIYDHDYWWSDNWDPMAYGREYDFSKPFFEQFRELMYAVPWPSRSIKNLVRSDYCNQVADLKDCYLCFNGGSHGDKSENCLYGIKFLSMRNSMDFYMTNNCELCYEVFSAGRCWQVFFTVESGDCRNVWFCLNCDNCSDCFGCVNLRHKQYHIFNEPHAKEEYMKKIKEFNLGSYRALEESKRKAHEFWSRFPMRYAHGTHNTNVVGEYIYHAKNVFRSYQGLNMENIRYSQDMVDARDSSDFTSWGGDSELIYEAVVCGENCYDLKFCTDCWPDCENLEYCMLCHSSSNLFGCVGLKKKQYCILNKEYSPQEFKELRKRIIEHMHAMPFKDQNERKYRYGEFFPPEFSPLGYNESAASDYFPKSKEAAAQGGFNWWEEDKKKFDTTIRSSDLPDHINDVAQDVTKEIIECLSCARAYRIVKPEFEFYKRFRLPLPRLCDGCRHRERMQFRNPMKWYARKCMCAGETSDEQPRTNHQYANLGLPHTSHKNGEHCPNAFETSYQPERPEIVYCEPCYQAEVI